MSSNIVLLSFRAITSAELRTKFTIDARQVLASCANIFFTAAASSLIKATVAVEGTSASSSSVLNLRQDTAFAINKNLCLLQ